MNWSCFVKTTNKFAMQFHYLFFGSHYLIFLKTAWIAHNFFEEESEEINHNKMILINQNHLTLRGRFLRFLQSLTRSSWAHPLLEHCCQNSQPKPSCLRKLGTHRFLWFCWNSYYVTDLFKDPWNTTSFVHFKISLYFSPIIFNVIFLWFVPGVIFSSSHLH